MWNELCNVYSPDAERKNELEKMDLKTLELLYHDFEAQLKFLKENNPKNKSIPGMELATQTIFDFMADKKLNSQN